MESLDVMILGVQKYEFEDEKTKRIVKGVSVHYCQLLHVNEDNKMGYFPAKASLSSHEHYEQFVGLKFPLQGQATITFDLSNKKNPIKITGFNDLQNIIID
jgi:hypothetical protein